MAKNAFGDEMQTNAFGDEVSPPAPPPTLPENLQQWAPHIDKAVATTTPDSVSPNQWRSYIAAVIDRESTGKNYGVGADGHGHGLMQIDDRSHEFANTPEVRDPEKNIAYGAGHLRDLYNQLPDDMPVPERLKRAADAYNAGPRALAADDPDAITTGGNYGSDVIRRTAAIAAFKAQNAGVEPPAATKALELAQQHGIGQQFAAENLPIIQDQAQKQETSQTLKQAPVLASWMAKSPVPAAAAKDDIGPLSMAEYWLTGRNLTVPDKSRPSPYATAGIDYPQPPATHEENVVPPFWQSALAKGVLGQRAGVLRLKQSTVGLSPNEEASLTQAEEAAGAPVPGADTGVRKAAATLVGAVPMLVGAAAAGPVKAAQSVFFAQQAYGGYFRAFTEAKNEDGTPRWSHAEATFGAGVSALATGIGMALTGAWFLRSIPGAGNKLNEMAGGAVSRWFFENPTLAKVAVARFAQAGGHAASGVAMMAANGAAGGAVNAVANGRSLKKDGEGWKDVAEGAKEGAKTGMIFGLLPLYRAGTDFARDVQQVRAAQRPRLYPGWTRPAAPPEASAPAAEEPTIEAEYRSDTPPEEPGAAAAGPGEPPPAPPAPGSEPGTKLVLRPDDEARIIRDIQVAIDTAKDYGGDVAQWQASLHAFLSDVGRAHEALTESVKIDQIVDTASVSKLVARSPQQAGQLFDLMAAQGQHQTAYIEHGALAANPEATAAVVKALGPEGLPALADAQARLDAVAVPIGTYAAAIGPEHHEALRPDVKLSPDGFTPRQAAEWQGKLPIQPAEVVPAAEPNSPEELVYQDFKAKLGDTPAAHETARLYARAFTQLAAREGQGRNAVDLAKDYPISINRWVRSVQDAKGDLLRQDAVRLREGLDTLWDVQGMREPKVIRNKNGDPLLDKNGQPRMTKNLTRIVGGALEGYTKEHHAVIGEKDYSDAAAEQLATFMAREVRYEYHPDRYDKSGAGWYSRKYPESLDQFAERHPELKTDPVARGMLTLLNAVTSPGSSVEGGDNQVLGARAYEQYTASHADPALRRIPETAYGRTPAVKASFKKINKLLTDYGPEGMHDFLLRVDTVENLLAELRKTKEGRRAASEYLTTQMLPVAATVLGPKVGAFYANLMGGTLGRPELGQFLTMDMWWMRMFNRQRGVMLKTPTRAGLNRFKQLLGDESMSDSDALDHAMNYEESYRATTNEKGLTYKHPVGQEELAGQMGDILAEHLRGPLTKAQLAQFDALDEQYKHQALEKASHTLYKTAFKDLNEQIRSPAARAFMIRTAKLAQEKLRAAMPEGEASDIRQYLHTGPIDISLSDLQGTLWYSEKRLYGKLGVQGKGAAGDVSFSDATGAALRRLAAGDTGARARRPARPGLERAGAGAVAGNVRGAEEAERRGPAGGEATPGHPADDIPRLTAPPAKPGPALVKLKQGTILKQSAWHGSPHIFDTFQMKHLGTGEGVQVYGHGLYFAKNRQVAEHYRDVLAEPAVSYKGIKALGELYDPLQMAGRAVGDRGPTEVLRYARHELAEKIERQRHALEDLRASRHYIDLAETQTTKESQRQNRQLDLARERVKHLPGSEERLGRLIDAERELHAIKPEDLKIDRGALYQVDVPEDHELLDYDKPLSQQPQGVLDKLLKAKLLGAGVSADQRGKAGIFARRLPDGTVVDARVFVGEGLYRELAHHFGSAEAASRHLKKAGIPGLRYLDEGSRDAGEGTHNFVVWDDARIRTLQTLKQKPVPPQYTPEARAARSEMMARIAKPDGGFSFSLLTGGEPKTGFGVSIHPDRSESYKVSEWVKDQDASLAKLDEFVDKNADLLTQDGKYLGAWHDPKTGLVFLDVSQSVTTAAEAEALARSHDQISYFDFVRGKSVDVNREATSGGAATHDDQTAPVPGNAAAAPEPGSAPAAGAEPVPEGDGAGTVPGSAGENSGEDGSPRRIEGTPFVIAPGEERGSIRIGALGENGGRHLEIDLNRIADESTAAHELGHGVSVMMLDIAAKPGADPKLVADVEAMAKFGGYKNADERRARLDPEKEEKIIDGLEQYLLEGKAPSQELTVVFADIRDMMKKIYGSFRAQLTDEMRGVWDRVFAATEPEQQPQPKPVHEALAKEYGGPAEAWAKAVTPQVEQTLTGPSAARQPMTKGAIAEQAIQKIEATPIGQIQPGRYTQAAKRAADKLAAVATGAAQGGVEAARQGFLGAGMERAGGEENPKAGKQNQREAGQKATAAEKTLAKDVPDLEQARDLNRALAEHATAVKAEMDKAYKVLTSSARDAALHSQLGLAAPSFRDVYDSLLEAVGAKKPEPRIEGEPPRQGLPELLQDLELRGLPVGFDEDAIGELLHAPKDWAKMIPPEARGVIDAALSLRTLSQRMGQIAVADKLQTLQETKQSVVLQNANRKDLGAPNVTRSAAEWLTRAPLAAAGVINAWNLKPETAFTTLGDTMGGVFRKTIDARNEKWKMQGEILRHFAERVKPINWLRQPVDTDLRMPRIGDPLLNPPPSKNGERQQSRALPDALARTYGGTKEKWLNLLADPRTLEEMPEVKAIIDGARSDFERSRTVQKVPDLEDRMNKETMAMLFLHLGTEGNEQRMTSGYNWDGQHVREEVGRNLSRDELDSLQGILDYLTESLWPLIREHAERTTGVAPKKVPAQEIVLKLADGTEWRGKGGYFPLAPHPDALNVPSYMEQEGVTQFDRLARATVNASFTKARAQRASYPVDLNWSRVGQHIDGVLHYLAYDQPVRDINTLLSDGQVQSIVRHSVGDSELRQLQSWVKLLAKGKLDNTSIMDRVARGTLRTRAVSNYLAFSAPISIMQASHIPFAVASGEISATNTAKAAARQIPFSDAWKATRNDSSELQFRSSRWSQLYRHAISGQNTDLAGGVGKTLDHVGFLHMEAADAVLSHIIYDAALNDALEARLETQAAKDRANAKVRLLMPTHNIFEMAPIVRDRGVLGALMLFRGLPNVVWNVNYGLFDRSRQAINNASSNPSRVGPPGAAPPLPPGTTVEMEDEGGGTFGMKKDAGIFTATNAARALGAGIALALIGKFLDGLGKDKKDDGPGLRGWRRWAVRHAIGSTLESLGPVHDIGQPLIDAAVDHKSMGWAVEKMKRSIPEMEMVYRILHDAGAVASKKSSTEQRVMGAVNAALMVGGVGGVPIASAGQNIYDALHHKLHPRGTADALDLAVYPTRKRTKTPLTSLQDLISGHE